MTLMRVLTRVDEEGKIRIPKNVERETGLEPGTPVEIKVTGPKRAQFITVRRCAVARRSRAPLVAR